MPSIRWSGSNSPACSCRISRRSAASSAITPRVRSPSCRRAAATSVLIAAFDAAAASAHIKPLMRSGATLVSFDRLRLPDDMLTDKRRYLNTLNFATNFVFFRDAKGQHTRLVTANYWSAYGGPGGYIWFRLFDSDGRELARLEGDAARRECRDRRGFARGARALLASRIHRPVVRPCRGRGRARHRQIRARHLWRHAGRALLHARCEFLAGQPLCRIARARRRTKTSCCGCRTPIPCTWMRARSASISWATTRSSRCRSRSVPSPRTGSASPICCRARAGRSRSRSAPASTWCVRATKSCARTAAAASRIPMSSARI